MFMVTTPDLFGLGSKVLVKLRRIGKLWSKQAQHNVIATPRSRTSAICFYNSFTSQAFKQKVLTHQYANKFCHTFPLSTHRNLVHSHQSLLGKERKVRGHLALRQGKPLHPFTRDCQSR